MIPEDYNGPRIVINPTTFKNQKDALCVSFNEAFRIVMSDMQFDPVSEPTERQRRFFSDTAYANDETQLRRTILARICTFDTSVKDPTDEQLEEAVEFLDSVMEAGIPQNDWEQSSVQRIHDVIAQSIGRQPVEEPEPEAPSDKGTVEADVGGGDADEDERRQQAIEFAQEHGMDTSSMDEMPLETVESVYKTYEEQAAGEQAAGEQAAGEQAAGEQAAGEPVVAPVQNAENQPGPNVVPESATGGFQIKTEKELSKMGVKERMDYNKQVKTATGMTSMQAARAGNGAVQAMGDPFTHVEGESFAQSPGNLGNFQVKTEKELSKMGVKERMDYNKQVKTATGMTSMQAARAGAIQLSSPRPAQVRKNRLS